MRRHTISVTVEDSSIRVEPDTMVMTLEDEVQWAGQNARKFSIEFDGEGPFGQHQLGHAAATSERRPRVKGRFKYTVISDDDPGLRLDPVIIVDPPPSGGTD